MTGKLAAWLEFTRGVTITRNGAEPVPFNADHPAYPIAMAAFYAGWNRGEK